jgi:hypothetical protein
VISTLPPDAARALQWTALARAVCRDPDPGAAGPALERIDAALAGAERLILDGGEDQLLALGLVHASAAIAATERVDGRGARGPYIPAVAPSD